MTVRAVLRVTRWAGMIALVAVIALANLAPRLGHQLLIIRGPSMEPTIPLGSIVFERPVQVASLAAGDVVTFTSSNGVVITHRIVDGPRVTSADDVVDGAVSGEATVLTKGDANTTPDPVRIPVSAILGVVEAHAPALGWVLAWLQLPTGLVSLVSLLGCLMVAEWLLEELEGDEAAAGAVVPGRPGTSIPDPSEA